MTVELKPNRTSPPDVTDFVGTLESTETMHLRIMIIGDEEDGDLIGSIKLELTNESDIFFHYVCILNEQTMIDLIEEQKLEMEYKDTLRIIHKLLDDINKFEVKAVL